MDRIPVLLQSECAECGRARIANFRISRPLQTIILCEICGHWQTNTAKHKLSSKDVFEKKLKGLGIGECIIFVREDRLYKYGIYD